MLWVMNKRKTKENQNNDNHKANIQQGETTERKTEGLKQRYIFLTVKIKVLNREN